MIATWVALSFPIMGPDSHREDAPADSSEGGEVIARTCAAAERFVRDGLRPGQEVLIHSCEPVRQGMAEVTR